MTRQVSLGAVSSTFRQRPLLLHFAQAQLAPWFPGTIFRGRLVTKFPAGLVPEFEERLFRLGPHGPSARH